MKKGNKTFCAAQSLSEKKFSEEDIRKAFEAGMEFIGEDKGSYEKLIQSLSQPKVFDVEVKMEDNMKCENIFDGNSSKIGWVNKGKQPKITNNSIKIIKVL